MKLLGLLTLLFASLALGQSLERQGIATSIQEISASVELPKAAYKVNPQACFRAFLKSVGASKEEQEAAPDPKRRRGCYLVPAQEPELPLYIFDITNRIRLDDFELLGESSEGGFTYQIWSHNLLDQNADVIYWAEYAEGLVVIVEIDNIGAD